MSGFADTFVQDAREQLREIESNLIELEDNPEDDEVMNAIFRSAHTLKGNAGAMGFDQCQDLAHVMEDVLAEMRSDDLEVTSDAIDKLFAGFDALEQMVDEIDANEETEYDASQEIESLHELAGTEDEVEEVEEESPQDEQDEDVDQCVAATNDGTRCENSPKEEEVLCGTHCKVREQEGEDAITRYDEVDHTHEDSDTDEESETSGVDYELVEDTEPPEGEEVATAYHVEIDMGGDPSEPIEALDDAFEILRTDPPLEGLDESVEKVKGIVVGNIREAEEIDNWFSRMTASVENVNVTDITDDVEWATGELEDISGGDDLDDVEIDSLDDVNDLIGTDQFDEIDEVEEETVDDVELGVDEMGDAESFEEAEVEDPVIEEDDDDLPDNKGARIFDELEGEVDEADDFNEIEEEMQEMGFGEEFDEMDSDEEVEFDELIEADTNEFDFDEDDGDGVGSGFGDDLDDAAAEETVGLFDNTEESDDDEDEVVADEENDSVDEVEIDTGIELSDEDDIAGGGLMGEDEEAERDPFSAGGSEETDTTQPESGSPEPTTTDDTSSDTGEKNDVGIGGTDDDLFDTEFDDDGSVDFDDLLREAGEEVDAVGDGDGGDEVETIDSIRVDVEQLDEMYSLVQELVTSRIRLRRAIQTGKKGELSQAFDELDTLEMVTSRMQDTVMDIRLVRLDRITDRLPRVVRDTARKNDKEVNFEIEGEDVELDRAILEQLGDPLMHIVRNSVDHGIEDPDVREANGKPRNGTVKLTARRTRDRVTIQVSDDGGGIDPQAVRQNAINEGILTETQAEELDDEQAVELIFHPGFSTSDEVSETSGRGVGLDVVYTTVRSLDGTVDVSSTPGEGTTINLRLPVSLAIDEVLLIEAGDEQYGIPVKNVDEITGVTDIEEVNGKQSHIHNGEVYPIIELGDALDLEGESAGDDGRLIRINQGVRKAVIQCDNVVESTEVVVEPYDGVLRTVPGLSGAAVLGEGNVVNILDVERL